MNDPPEKLLQLVSLIRLGDLQALARVFALQRPRLLRTVQFRLDRRLAGRIDPEDVLQEAYLAAVDRIGHFSGETAASLYVWLRLIVTQCLADLYRRHHGAQKRDVGREVSLQATNPAQNTSCCIAVELSGKLTSPSQAAIREEQSRRLQELIEEMDEIDREVLALRHFEELTNSETAEVLGIQPKAASIRYIRALRRLKDVMSAAGYSDDLK
ncbi:sigma-70 family RNA polymerase sigma factor [Aeoliella mucimassa]|uniref:ECF RNA polymerase sigma factor SigD n=1 Tax=Aeoliella mucimassa TaxID=2527972 RepID=A0A518AMG9_9BACT|nr:sigma-70 family RNA polymerase sigma factor [Aeoliella mucimassa]QDU55925.1 ECF RNA polymerase sigma factor SigD [Aeoliella mucimassa]